MCKFAEYHPDENQYEPCHECADCTGIPDTPVLDEVLKFSKDLRQLTNYINREADTDDDLPSNYIMKTLNNSTMNQLETLNGKEMKNPKVMREEKAPMTTDQVISRIKDVLPAYQFAVGGSLALGQGTDKSDVDLIVRDFDTINKFIDGLDKPIYRGLTSDHAFRPVAQVYVGEVKVDVFIVPNLTEWSVLKGDVRYIKPEVVWAARGFYAGLGAMKAQNQMVDAGIVRTKFTRTRNEYTNRTTYGGGNYGSDYGSDYGSSYGPQKNLTKKSSRRRAWVSPNAVSTKKSFLDRVLSIFKSK